MAYKTIGSIISLRLPAVSHGLVLMSVTTEDLQSS